MLHDTGCCGICKPVSASLTVMPGSIRWHYALLDSPTPSGPIWTTSNAVPAVQLALLVPESRGAIEGYTFAKAGSRIHFLVAFGFQQAMPLNHWLRLPQEF